MVSIIVADAYALADGIQHGRSLAGADELEMIANVSSR